MSIGVFLWKTSFLSPVEVKRQKLFLWATLFGTVVQTALSMSIGSFSVKYLFWNICPFFFIFGHWEEEYASIVLKVQQGCQNCVLRSIGIVWGKSALSPENCFFEHFLAWNKSFGLIAENFWQCCQIFILTVHKTNFRKKNALFFFSFSDIERKKLHFPSETLRQGSQNLRSRVPYDYSESLFIDNLFFSFLVF